MYFYFDDLFQQALRGINATAVPTTMAQIAGTILLAALLFNVYEAFARGGDVRTLATGAAKYLILGLILLNYERIFLGVNTMFTQVAEFISRMGPGGMDVLRTWGSQTWNYAMSNPAWSQRFWPLVSGGTPALLGLTLKPRKYISERFRLGKYSLFNANKACRKWSNARSIAKWKKNTSLRPTARSMSSTSSRALK